MVRLDGVPFHHLLAGTVSPAKRAAAPLYRSLASPYSPGWRSSWNSPSACTSEQLVVAAGAHLLMAVVAILVDMPDRQALVGQRGVASRLLPVLDQEVLAAAAASIAKSLLPAVRVTWRPCSIGVTLLAQPDRRLR